MAPRRTAHPWSFTRSIRPNAFGWRSSKLAIARLREAMAEIRAVARLNPALGAEGAVNLLCRLAPTFRSVDTSTGALGNAVNRAVHVLVDLVVAARPSAATEVRRAWIERLSEALREDGFDFLWELQQRWDQIDPEPDDVPGTPNLPPGTSVSRTLLEFAEPILAGAEKADEPRVTAAMTVATAVWNAVVLTDSGRGEQWLEMVRRQTSGTPEVSMIVDMLVTRKRERFAAQVWTVGDFEVFDRDGECRLRVEARSLPPPVRA